MRVTLKARCTQWGRDVSDHRANIARQAQTKSANHAGELQDDSRTYEHTEDQEGSDALAEEPRRVPKKQPTAHTDGPQDGSQSGLRQADSQSQRIPKSTRAGVLESDTDTSGVEAHQAEQAHDDHPQTKSTSHAGELQDDSRTYEHTKDQDGSDALAEEPRRVPKKQPTAHTDEPQDGSQSGLRQADSQSHRIPKSTRAGVLESDTDTSGIETHQAEQPHDDHPQTKSASHAGEMQDDSRTYEHTKDQDGSDALAEEPRRVPKKQPTVHTDEPQDGSQSGAASSRLTKSENSEVNSSRSAGE